MAICSLTELKAQLRPRSCLLGLDMGSKTIGLAVSDPTMMVASPLQTITRRKFSHDVEALRQVMSEREVGGLVIGLPVSMDGTEGPRCQSVRQFAENVLEVVNVAIAFWDERLSTAAVERVLIDEADMTRKRRAQVIDKMAAAYILQGALDSLA